MVQLPARMASRSSPDFCLSSDAINTLASVVMWQPEVRGDDHNNAQSEAYHASMAFTNSLIYSSFFSLQILACV